MARTFDPYWNNARAFLDYLSDRNLIERDILNARMGQFVLVTGKLAVLDLSPMQSIWSMPLFKQMLSEEMVNDSGDAGNRQQRRAQGKGSTLDPFAGQPTIFRLAMELIPTFPHSTVALVISETWSTWSTLTAEHLVGSATDLLLKHGNKIAGDWSMLAVLDAFPDRTSDNIDDVDIFFATITDTSIVPGAMVGLSSIMRTVAGRPAQSFGVTLLLIFREIAHG